MKKVQTAKKLQEIWKQVPIDYYDKGIKINLLQKIWHNNKLRIFKTLLMNYHPKNIIDIGCASGTFTYQISKIFPNSNIIGMDSYKEVIDYAKEKYPSLEFTVADAHKLPFKDNSFDLTVCYETIEHVIDPRKVLTEIYRVTKVNGNIILAMDSGSWLFRIVWWIWERTKGKVWRNAHLHPFHHSELEQLIKQAKFKIIKKRFSHIGMEVSFVLKKINREI